MPTLSEMDSKQEGIDWRVKDLRKQIPETGSEPKDAKPLTPEKRRELEAEMEAMRNPRREPERKNPYAPKEVADEPQPKPSSRPKKSVGVLTEEPEK